MYMQARQLVDTVTMTQNWLLEDRYVIYDNFCTIITGTKLQYISKKYSNATMLYVKF
jgi:hypothetical protein